MRTVDGRVSKARFLLLLVPFALLALACSTYEPPADRRVAPPRETASRQDCNAIMGTAFRSGDERAWFEQNCSRWPAAVAVAAPSAPVAPVAPVAPPPNPRPQSAAPAPGDTPECAALRGRPYPSEAVRLWFLANCMGQSGAAAPPPDPGPQPLVITAPPGAQPQPYAVPGVPAVVPQPFAGAGQTPPVTALVPASPPPQPAPASVPSPAPRQPAASVPAPTPVPQIVAPNSSPSCEQVRRNPNPTDAERRYFFTYCSQ